MLVKTTHVYYTSISIIDEIHMYGQELTLLQLLHKIYQNI